VGEGVKPPKFQYWDPENVDGVVGFLADHGDEAKLLAGGQSLMPVLAMRLARPEYLVDLNRVPGLDGIGEDGGSLTIGALVRQDALRRSDIIERSCPLLWKAIPYIGHSAIRYRGTIGGSVVHADPSAELPAVMLALDAEFTIRSAKGSRVVPARDFFETYFTTAVRPDELLTEIRVPSTANGTATAIQELARRHGDFALAGVAAVVRARDGRVDEARIVAFGVDEAPVRLEEVERLVAGQAASDELLSEAGERAARAVEPESDIHASADYRRGMTGVLTRRALREAVAEASGTSNGGKTGHGV
jgi:CO/xanthine dehydrogenase FAD-binding subunit